MEFGGIRSCPHCGDMHGSLCAQGASCTSSCDHCLKAAGFEKNIRAFRFTCTRKGVRVQFLKCQVDGFN